MKKLFLIITLLLITLTTNASRSYAQTCTTTPPTNTGTSTLSATTTAGTYKVWARMKAADTSNNSFYLRIDTQCAILIGDNNQISSTGWTWVDYQNGVTSSKINTTLTAGDHVITIIGNEPGVGVDKILLTKNLTCVPTGFGDNCPAETPTSTPTPDTTAPIISAVTANSITQTSASITWTLNEPGTGQVEYGTTTSYGTPSTLESSFNYTTHVQTISGLAPGTTYHYRVKSSDQAGNQRISGDFTFTTLGGNSPTPTVRPSNTPTPTNIPTPTPTPVVTATPLETVLKFSIVKLHGIGTGGDNTNPNIGGNNNPITQTRVLTVELYNDSGALTKTVQGNIVYGASNGYFSGSIILDSGVAEGRYLIKIKTDKYLRRQLSKIITVTKGTVIDMPEATLVTGDSNGDGTLSILDYNVILDCYSDFVAPKNCSDPAKKTKADLSDDGLVNHDDHTLFLRELSVVSGD